MQNPGDEDVNAARRFRVAVLSVALVVIAMACGSQLQPAAPTTVTTTTVTNVAANGAVQIVGPSWTIEVDADVRYESVSKSGFGDPAVLTTKLNGVPFEIRDGRFFLGTADLGPVPAGVKVRVTAEGVFVDGERRGATPKLLDSGGE